MKNWHSINTAELNGLDIKKIKTIMVASGGPKWLVLSHLDKLIIDKDIAKVSIVGIGMRAHAGIAKMMFEALAKERINIIVISTSEIKISVLIKRKYMELAVQTLHDTFELEKA